MYTFNDLAEKLRHPKIARISFDEFLALPKENQLRYKDQGGFIGGIFEQNRKISKALKARTLLTIDLDHAPCDFEKIVSDLPFRSILYSTFKHTADNPRFRLVIPFTVPISTKEYYREIARGFVRKYLQKEWVDPASYKAAQIMFWPVVPEDHKNFYVFICKNDGIDLDPSSIEIDPKLIAPNSQRVQNPLEKKGPVGLFCRAYYPIQSAIETFLKDIYAQSDLPERFTYLKGESDKGLVIYDQDTFAYSFHQSDPVGDGRLKNAYDLVCTHLFNGNEELMNELVSRDERCTKQLHQDQICAFGLQIGQSCQEPAGFDWVKKLEINEKTGSLKNTIRNIELILENDPRLEGIGGKNLFNNQHEKTNSLPWWIYDGKKAEWTDCDDSFLWEFLESNYHLLDYKKTESALKNVAVRHAFHPIRDHLNSLFWDGTDRVETFFTDYFGADDTPYTRAAARKMFAAAVARIFEPGIKFDYVVVLVGDQGIGKSYTISRLAYDRWFTDSLSSFKGKEAYEALMGNWIVEISEMTAYRRSEMDEMKQFISATRDCFRPAYGRKTEQFLRQNIFIGSINDFEFLRDQTGNRRYWPIACNIKNRILSPFQNLTDEVVDQIWAQAVQIYQAGEKLYLEEELAEIAKAVQEDHSMISDEEIRALEFASQKICEGWFDLDLDVRRDFIPDHNLVEREFISALEVWVVGLGRERDAFKNADQRRISGYLRKNGWIRSGKKQRLDPFAGQQRYFVKAGCSGQG